MVSGLILCYVRRVASGCVQLRQHMWVCTVSWGRDKWRNIMHVWAQPFDAGLYLKKEEEGLEGRKRLVVEHMTCQQLPTCIFLWLAMTFVFPLLHFLRPLDVHFNSGCDCSLEAEALQLQVLSIQGQYLWWPQQPRGCEAAQVKWREVKKVFGLWTRGQLPFLSCLYAFIKHSHGTSKDAPHSTFVQHEFDDGRMAASGCKMQRANPALRGQVHVCSVIKEESNQVGVAVTAGKMKRGDSALKEKKKAILVTSVTKHLSSRFMGNNEKSFLYHLGPLTMQAYLNSRNA